MSERLSFGYEDTDKKIEMDLYGLVFEIKNIDSIEDLKGLDSDNQNIIETQLEKILGVGAIEKINRKRISDGRNELDLNIELNILGCIFETYAKATTGGVIDNVTSIVNGMNNDIDKISNINREQRRNYNRNNNYYRGNRKNYRRY